MSLKIQFHYFRCWEIVNHHCCTKRVYCHQRKKCLPIDCKTHDTDKRSTSSQSRKNCTKWIGKQSYVLNILFNVLLYCRYCSLVFTQSFFYAKELMEIVNKRRCSGVFCRMATLKNFIKLLGKNLQKTCKISVPYKNTLSRVVSR